MGGGHGLLLVEAGMLEGEIRANRTMESIFSLSEAGSMAFELLWVSAVPPNRPIEGSPEKYKRVVEDPFSQILFLFFIISLPSSSPAFILRTT